MKIWFYSVLSVLVLLALTFFVSRWTYKPDVPPVPPPEYIKGDSIPYPVEIIKWKTKRRETPKDTVIIEGEDSLVKAVTADFDTMLVRDNDSLRIASTVIAFKNAIDLFQDITWRDYEYTRVDTFKVFEPVEIEREATFIESPWWAVYSVIITVLFILSSI
jgi:hypothetical protein